MIVEMGTYSLSNGNIVLETGDDSNLIVFQTALDDLSASDIGKSSVIEQSGRESGSLGNVFRAESANENVVVEQGLEEAFLLGSGRVGAVQRIEGIVGRSQKRDVRGSRKCFCDVGVALQQSDKPGKVLVSSQSRGEVDGFLSSSCNNSQRGSQNLLELHGDCFS